MNTKPLPAKRKLKRRIIVTQADIDQGTPRSPDWCPVACALRRTYRDTECSMGVTMLTVKGRSFKHHNLRLAKWVERFDSGEAVKPFSFYLSR